LQKVAFALETVILRGPRKKDIAKRPI